MSETDVFLGPNTNEGMSAKVVHGLSTSPDEFFDTWLIYHVNGIENIESRVAEIETGAFGGMVTIEFVDGGRTQIRGSIETVNP